LSAIAQLPDDKDLLLWIGEGNGVRATDATGNKNHGSLHDGATWVDGRRTGSKAIDLMKNGSFVEIPGVLKAKGTIEFWFKPSWDGADGNDYRLFDASLKPICFFITKGADHGDWNNNEFGMMSEDVADANLEVLTDPAGKIKKMNGFILLLLGNIMKERVEKRHTLYTDGKEWAKQPNVGLYPKLHPKPRFGHQTGDYISHTNGAKGLIDNIAIYRKALTPKEIKRDMEASLAVDADTAVNHGGELSLT